MLVFKLGKWTLFWNEPKRDVEKIKWHGGSIFIKFQIMEDREHSILPYISYKPSLRVCQEQAVQSPYNI